MISLEIPSVEMNRYKTHGMVHIFLEGCIPGTEYEIEAEEFGKGRVFPLNYVWISERKKESMKIILANIHANPKKNAISVDHSKKLESILITFPVHKNPDAKSIIKLNYALPEVHAIGVIREFVLQDLIK